MTRSGACTGTGTGSGSRTGSDVGDVIDSSFNVIASSYRNTAAQLSKDAGIEYRYGPNAAAYGVGNGGMPTLYARDARTQLASPAPSHPFYWQVGGPPSSSAGASTNQANMVFVADNPTQRIGVADFQVSGYMFNTFAQLPQLGWTRAAVSGGGIDSINSLSYKASGLVTGDPIAVGRCTGRSGFCNESLVAYQNGVIATAGSNTATNQASVKLPANKVPTAITMTTQSEFALVTVWDTTALKGQVAVIALAGLCDGCDPYNSSGHTIGNVKYEAYYKWWNEWMAPYPGLPNMGSIALHEDPRLHRSSGHECADRNRGHHGPRPVPDLQLAPTSLAMTTRRCRATGASSPARASTPTATPRVAWRW